MNYTDIVREGNRKQIDGSSNMKRTLFIGLGGSGKEVLMRLRRKFYASTEDKYGYDFIRYLWIDTDTSDTPICDENWTEIGRSISLGSRDGINEVFNASIDPDTLIGFYDRVNTFPHIREWLPVDALRPLGQNALMNGAKGIRPLGRLAFSWYINQIRNVIEQNLSQLNVKFNVPGVILDSNTEVYIIGSLAGGTGSGMFLEIAKMIKAYSAAMVYGVFFMSDMFQGKGNNDYRDANCYAALQELDFYQSASNKLDPLISQERHMFDIIMPDGSEKPFDLPIYNNVFLISNEYYKSPREDQFADPFEMVAEVFYFDFDNSAFGALKRSQSVNTKITGSQASVKYIMRDIETGENVGVESTYHSDYSSFALSGVFLNISKMKNWGSYKYLVDLLDKLIKDRPADPQLFETPGKSFQVSGLEFTDIFHQISQGTQTSSVLENYKFSLNAKKQEQIKKTSAAISFDHNTIQRVQEVCQNQLKMIDQFIQNEQQIMQHELITFRGTEGNVLSKLNQNSEHGLYKCFEDVERLLYEILANTNTGGVKTSEEMLNRVKDIMNKMDVQVNNFENTLKAEELSVDDELPKHPEIVIDSRIINFIQMIQDCEEIPWVFPFYKNKAKKYFNRRLSSEISSMNREIMKQIREYFDQCTNLISKRFESMYNKKVVDIIILYKVKIMNLIDSESMEIQGVRVMGLLRQLQSYKEIVSNLKSHFFGFEDDLRKQITSSLNRKLILDKRINQDNVYRDFTARLIGDDWFTSQVSDLYISHVNRIEQTNPELNSNSLKFIKTLVFYSQVPLGNITMDIKQSFREACRREFEKFMQDKSVLDNLADEIRGNEMLYKQTIGQMLANLNFRLPLSQSYTELTTRVTDTSLVTIAGLPASNEFVENFLKSNGSVKNIKYHGSKESILFYSETFGYPLFMLKYIEQLEDDFKRNTKDSANTRYYRYTDMITDYLRPLVVPQTPEKMNSILSSWELLYEAIVLRIIQFDLEKKTWKATIENENDFYTKTTTNFGKTLEAVMLRLSNSESLSKAIREMQETVFAEKFNESGKLKLIWHALYKNYGEVTQFINNQYITDNKPLLPQQFVLKKLLYKYLRAYMQDFPGMDERQVQKDLTQESESVAFVSSGFRDSMHFEGLMIYPRKD